MENELFADIVVIYHHEKLFASPSTMMISQKVAMRLYSTGEEISSPAIRNKFGWFHPHLRPALIRARPVDGLPNNSFTTV